MEKLIILYISSFHCKKKTKAATHKSSEVQGNSIGQKVIQIYEVTELFLNHTEYAIKMFLVLYLLNLSVNQKQQVYRELKLV